MTKPTREKPDLKRGVYRRHYAGAINGKRINSVSIEAEAWFWRIHAAADDYGNTHGDPVLLRNITAGRREVSADQVAGWIDELTAAGLLIAYTDDEGDAYLHVDGWQERQVGGLNGKRIERYPREPSGTDPDTGASGCAQVDPGESGCIPVNPSVHQNQNQDQNQHTPQPLAEPERPENPGPGVCVAAEVGGEAQAGHAGPPLEASAAPAVREPDPRPSPAPATDEPPPGKPDTIGLELLLDAGMGKRAAERAASEYSRDAIRTAVGNVRRKGGKVETPGAYLATALREGWPLDPGASPALTAREAEQAKRAAESRAAQAIHTDTATVQAQREGADAARAAADADRQRMRDRVAEAWDHDPDAVAALIDELASTSPLIARHAAAAKRDGPANIGPIVPPLYQALAQQSRASPTQATAA